MPMPKPVRLEEEAYVEYDSNGSETNFVHSDTYDAGGDENGQVSDSTKLDKYGSPLCPAFNP